MHSIQTVIFDVDGTLIDESESLHQQTEQVAWKFGRSLADRQRVVDAFFRANDRAQRLQDEGALNVKGDIPWYMRQIGEELGMPVTAQESEQLAAAWSAAYHGAHNNPTLFPDALPALDQLHRSGYRLIVASGNTVETREKLLRGAGIRQFFDAIYAAIDVGFQKQDRRFWLTLIDTEHAAPERMMMVGNQTNDDIMHPAALGMKTCFVRRSDKLTKNLDPGGIEPAYTVDNLDQLVHILQPRVGAPSR